MDGFQAGPKTLKTRGRYENERESWNKNIYTRKTTQIQAKKFAPDALHGCGKKS